MKLQTDKPELYNDISESIRAFLNADQIELTENDADITVTEREEDGFLTVAAAYAGKCFTHREPMQYGDPLLEKRLRRHGAKLAVYGVLKEATGRVQPWGSLTGIRPTKLWREVGSAVLEQKYDLSAEKASLLAHICAEQAPYFVPENDEIDVYVGIPFCRTRCSYCSFSSTDSTKGEALMRPYVKALLCEIEDTASLLKRLGRHVRCLYFGGGTPTALPEELFATVLERAAEVFTPTKEFTVEAGRPDTITEQKLQTMKKCGVGRISINPQSMNADTLKRIGRSHSPEEIVDCFALARAIGFRTVNADLIAGLPAEAPCDFDRTLEQVLALKPENITVHTLALKRGSILAQQGYEPSREEDVRRMVETARVVLQQQGYDPYYLYRQKYMTGNLENIGYTLPGHTGIYNIDIMEETTDILALGCGGVSKRIFPAEDRLERAFNFKSIYAYIDGIAEADKRKCELFS